MPEIVSDTNQIFETPLAAANQVYLNQSDPGLGAEFGATVQANEARFGLGPASERGTVAGSTPFEQAAAQLAAQGGDPDEQFTTLRTPLQSPLIAPEEANEKYAPRDPTGKIIPFADKPMPDALAQIIGRQKSEAIERQSVLARFAATHSGLTTFAVGALASQLDPLQLSLNFVPGVGEGAILSRLGEGFVARTVARLGAGAVTGAGVGAFQAGISALAALDPDAASDYGMRDALRDILYSAAGMAAFHAGFGAIGDVVRWLRPPEPAAPPARGLDAASQNAVMRGTIGPLVEGRSPDLGAFFYQPPRTDTAIDLATRPVGRAELVSAPDVQAEARRLAPDTFARYDPLVQRANDLRAQILNPEATFGRDIDQEIAQLRAKAEAVRGEQILPIGAAPEEVRASIAQQTARYEEATKAADALERGRAGMIHAHLAAARVAFAGVDAQLRDIAATGEVARALSQAETNVAARAGGQAPAMGPAEVSGATAIAAAERATRPLEGGIAGDIGRQLAAAGRPAEEADALGKLVESYYQRRAATFQGARGTAEEMYRADAPDIVRGLAGELAPGELGQRGVTDTVKSDNAIESARTDQGQALPARVPTGVNAPANALTDANAIPDLATLQSNPRLFENTVNAVGNDPGLRASGQFTDLQAKAEYLIGRLRDNLLWLYDQVPAEIRERSRLWYDGAQAIATEWAGRWDKTRAQTAGMLAVLSPQKDWFMNTTMAERIGDILYRFADHRWDPAMDAQAFKFLVGETATSAENRAAYAAIKDKTLREVVAAGDPVHTGMWLRAYDEAHHSAAYAIITPEGAYVGNMLTQAGEEARRAWGDFGAIGKAASIFMDGSPENISRQIGAEHKVRNFYNNIFNASDPRYVTVDTHAVAAGELRPLAGNDQAVEANFGGTGSDRATGLKGSYALHAEAYRRAAEERGVLPREIQSVTWEAVRGLFPDTWKTKANKLAVDAIWDRVDKGELSIDDARTAIHTLANGIAEPAWHNQSEGSINLTDRTTTYAAPREPGRGGQIMFEVAPDPRNTALVARWAAIPQTVRDRISHYVAWNTAKSALEGAGEALWGTAGKQQRAVALKAELQRGNGAWLADPNPSLSLQFDPGVAPAKVGMLSRLLGYALRQEETLRTSPKPFPGGTETGIINVNLPRDFTPAQIHEVYQQIRELTDANGEPYALGHTTGGDGVMHILNNNDRATIGTVEFAKLINDKLGGQYNVDDDTLYAERVQAGGNDYALSGKSETRGVRGEVPEQSLRRAGNTLRAEAEQYLEEQLRAHEAGDLAAGGGEPVTAPAARGEPGELEQAGRGKIRLTTGNARALITLFQNADASTFAHEFAHHAATEFFADAAHPLAPPQLREDVKTLGDWLGMKEGQTRLTRAQQEQLATGFEQYAREGRAPTPALNNVFAKLRDWMLQIYRTISELGVPINDEVRGVFDRWLAPTEAPGGPPGFRSEITIDGRPQTIGGPVARAPPAGINAIDLAVRQLAAQREGWASGVGSQELAAANDAVYGKAEPAPAPVSREAPETALLEQQIARLPPEALHPDDRAELARADEAVTQATAMRSVYDTAASCLMGLAG